MPKGSNPNSHHNKYIVPGGIVSTLTLTNQQWGFLKIIGQGNKSKGGREVVRAMEIIAKGNWKTASETLGCEATPCTIANKLIELFPGIQKGRKNQDDLVQELALGECALLQKDDKLVRVVNLVSVAVIDGDRKLVEAYQQLASGEIFPRGIEGVAEKIQYPETPEQGAYRGLAEELQVVPATLEYLGEVVEKNRKSKYEGIESYARKHQFRATLKPEDIKDEYQESREGNLTVFKWVTE